MDKIHNNIYTSSYVAIAMIFSGRNLTVSRKLM